MQFALVHCQQLYQSKHWALQCTLSSSLDALMHCTLVLELTDGSLVWFGLLEWTMRIAHIGPNLSLLWIGFCSLDFAVWDFFSEWFGSVHTCFGSVHTCGDLWVITQHRPLASLHHPTVHRHHYHLAIHHHQDQDEQTSASWRFPSLRWVSPSPR